MRREQAERRARELLTERGLRQTPQRVAVLAELVRERDDATAQRVHDALRARGTAIGLATVYRTLGLLAEAGVVDTLSHHRGELCYRLCGEGHHHHLVCTDCHRVVELDCNLDAWLQALATAHGFSLGDHRLEVTGRCASCSGGARYAPPGTGPAAPTS
jgi:Fur family ferric uptake transcriptional regulator